MMRFSVFSKNTIFLAIVALAVVVYCSTAIRSHGFYHADEHYQIVEFAGLKLGTHTPDELAWEFKAQIRQSLQPVICFVLFETFDILNINEPYNRALFLRLLSALIAILIISRFLLNTREVFKSENVKIAYYLLSFFLWFIPIISVRFSSETWSGLFFLAALSLFKNDSGA